MHGASHSQSGAEAHEAVNRNANRKVEGRTEVNLESLMLEEVREVRFEREKINQIAEKDCDQVLEPAPPGSAEESLRHRFR